MTLLANRYPFPITAATFISSVPIPLVVMIACAPWCSAYADAPLPSAELLLLLGEWQPQDPHWLQQLESIDRLPVEPATPPPPVSVEPGEPTPSSPAAASTLRVEAHQ
ncbi:MAG: hypothetical protein VW985_04680 [Gammaproteobacteria bacterium]